MARASDRITENVDGDFFVDSSCIDCDLCRQLAPLTFDRIYSGFEGELLESAAAEAVRFSAQRYIDWATDAIRDPDERA